MRLKSIQANAFKSLLEVLKEIINDVNIYFGPDGMKLIAFDVARVTLIHVFMAAENFEEYECPKETIVGINVPNTFKLIKSIGNNDIITMSTCDENLNICVSNDNKKSVSNFKLKLLDLNEDILDVPEINMEYSTTLSSIDFQKLVRDMTNIGSDIIIKRTGTSIEFVCDGDFANQQTIIHDQLDIGTAGLSGTFSLKYVSMFTKSTILCPIVQLGHGDDPDGPIVFKYTISNLGDVKFYLAPLGNVD
jgi:proliferating cell nuclear antigen